MGVIRAGIDNADDRTLAVDARSVNLVHSSIGVNGVVLVAKVARDQ